MLIGFNYETEPLPGIGPFTLLEGKEMPIDHRMLLAGKWS